MNPEGARGLHRLMPYLGLGEGRERVEETLREEFACLGDLLSASKTRLSECGVPESGTALLHLILPAARVAYRERLVRERTVCDTEEKLGNIFCDMLRHRSKEHVAVALLDGDLRLTDLLELSEGTESSAPVVLRRLAEVALRGNASFVAIAHNHPGGETEASPEDFTTTQAIKRCLDSLQMPLLEHFVVAEDRYLPLLIEAPNSPICGKINPASFYARSTRQRAGLNY